MQCEGGFNGNPKGQEHGLRPPESTNYATGELDPTGGKPPKGDAGIGGSTQNMGQDGGFKKVQNQSDISALFEVYASVSRAL